MFFLRFQVSCWIVGLTVWKVCFWIFEIFFWNCLFFERIATFRSGPVRSSPGLWYREREIGGKSLMFGQVQTRNQDEDPQEDEACDGLGDHQVRDLIWILVSHWIGLREIYRKPWFLPSNIGLSCKISHHPILCVRDGKREYEGFKGSNPKEFHWEMESHIRATTWEKLMPVRQQIR